MAEPDPSILPHPRRWRLIFLVLLAAAVTLVGGFYALYIALTIPVMPPEKMEEAFKAAREHLKSASPERIELGKQYLELFGQVPLRPPGNWDKADRDNAEYAAATRKWLQDSTEFLANVRALAAQGPGAIELDIDQGPSLLLPWMAQARELARLLCIEMEASAKAGDGERLLLDAKAVDCVAQTIEHRSVLVGRLVGIAVRSMALQQLLRQRAAIDEKTAKTLIDALAQMEASLPDPCDSLWGEMMMSAWLYDRKDIGVPGLAAAIQGGNLQPGRLPGLGRRLIVKQISTTLILQQDMQAAAKLPPPQAIPQLKQIEGRLNPGNLGLIARYNSFLAGMIVPALSSAYEHEIRERASLRGARIALALELYRRQHKAYPDQLSALTPAFLKKLPVDPFSLRDFKYLRRGDEYLLYSIGGNLADDGGQAETGKEHGDLLIRGADYVIVRPRTNGE